MHRLATPWIWAAVLSCTAAGAFAEPATLQNQTAGDPPWAVASLQRVTREPFDFQSAGTTLAGTLTLPEGRRNIPVVIVLHAATVGLRGAPLYRHLQEMLPPLGVAVLVFDRRGEGQSGGRNETHGFDELAADGVAAFEALARDPRIDHSRIGFWGLSQGGWLALLAAAKQPSAAFVVAASAPMVPADVQMNFAVANLLRVAGYGPQDVEAAITARRAVDAYARGRLARSEAEKAEAAVATKPWYRLIFLKGNIDDPGWPKQMNASALSAVEESHVPTLLIYGQRDPWVPVSVSLDVLRRVQPTHQNLSIAVIDGADHMMMLGVDPRLQMDVKAAAADAPDAPAYFARMTSWLTEQEVIRAAENHSHQRDSR